MNSGLEKYYAKLNRIKNIADVSGKCMLSAGVTLGIYNQMMDQWTLKEKDSDKSYTLMTGKDLLAAGLIVGGAVLYLGNKIQNKIGFALDAIIDNSDEVNKLIELWHIDEEFAQEKTSFNQRLTTLEELLDGTAPKYVVKAGTYYHVDPECNLPVDTIKEDKYAGYDPENRAYTVTLKTKLGRAKIYYINKENIVIQRNK